MAVGLSSCVIDTSAIVAIYAREAEIASITAAIDQAIYRILPPRCMVEFAMLGRFWAGHAAWLDIFVAEYDLTIVPMDAKIAELAIQAARHYGRGSGHVAKLNFGDCMSYAFARHFNAPLLFKGEDFIHTDVLKISLG